MSRERRRLAKDSQRTPKSIVQLMSDGDKETMDFLDIYIKKDAFSLVWIDVLDNYQIYGRSILTFFNKCCNQSFQRFTETLMGLDNYAYGDYYDQKRMVKASIRDEVAFAFDC